MGGIFELEKFREICIARMIDNRIEKKMFWEHVLKE